MTGENKRSISAIRLDDPESVSADEGERSVAYFCKKLPARVDHELITRLKGVFKKLGDRNLRLCLHSGPDALFHEMIIFERRGKYYRPHKHADKGETFHIIEGEMGAFSFDDSGHIIDACTLSLETNLIYRVKVNAYHAVLPVSDYVIYHESKPGPFIGQGTAFIPPGRRTGPIPGKRINTWNAWNRP